MNKINKYLITLDKNVKVSTDEEEIVGIALDIELDGSLIVKLDTGNIMKVSSGDVIHLR